MASANLKSPTIRETPAFESASETHRSLPEAERKRLAFERYCQHRPTPFWKRSCDLTAAITLALLLSPALVLIALFIRLTSGGPVLFKQKRLGEMGREFVIYKFRTLRTCSRATDEHRKFVNDLSSKGSAISKPDLSSRLIPGGNFLRRTSLDELPQLLNIIRGEMSLIGPRPDVLHWNDYQPWQLKRFEVLPGVTGLWQVSGKNRLTFNEMIDKDIEYVSNRSISLDLKIVLKTIRMLLLRENA